MLEKMNWQGENRDEQMPERDIQAAEYRHAFGSRPVQNGRDDDSVLLQNRL
jgi:hypothetical protein